MTKTDNEKKKNITIRLSDDMRSALERNASLHGESIGAAARRLIFEGLSKGEGSTGKSDHELLEDILGALYGATALEFFYLAARSKIDLDTVIKEQKGFKNEAGIAAFAQTPVSGMFETSLDLGREMLESDAEMNSALVKTTEQFGFEPTLWKMQPSEWRETLRAASEKKLAQREEVAREKQGR